MLRVNGRQKLFEIMTRRFLFRCFGEGLVQKAGAAKTFALGRDGDRRGTVLSVSVGQHKWPSRECHVIVAHTEDTRSKQVHVVLKDYHSLRHQQVQRDPKITI